MPRNRPSKKFFQIFVRILPQLNRTFEECGLTMREWTIISCIQRLGVQNERREVIMLRLDLTEALLQSGILDANITRVLNSLQDKGLIQRRTLRTQERSALFPASLGGNRMAIMLQPTAEKKIEQFKEKITILARKIISQKLNWFD